MDPDLRRRIEDLLLALPQWERYDSLLAGILRGHPIWLEVQTEGNQRDVARRLLDLCTNPTTPLHGHPPPICALLAGLAEELAAHPAHGAEVRDLSTRLCQGRRARPRPV